MYRRPQELSASHQAYHVPAPPPRPKPVYQLSHQAYHIPAPPSRPKPVNQASLELQPQTRKARRSHREAPQVVPQANNKTSAQCAEADLQGKTRKARRSHREAPQVVPQANNKASALCAEADRELQVGRRPQYIPPGGFSQNMPNRYTKSSPTFEERDRALDEHADRIYWNRLQTQMFGEDLSSSKLPAKKRGKKPVRTMEKLHQLEQERHNAVPFNDEDQLLRAVYTTAMFGEDLSETPAAARRAPVQPSLVGARSHYARNVQGTMRVEKTRQQRQPEPDVYITVEDADYRAQRLQQQATKDRSSERTASKPSSLAQQRHSLTGRRTAAADTTSDHPLESLLIEPRPPEAAKPESDQSARARAWHQKRAQRRQRDSRILKRRCESPCGPARKH